MADHDARSNDSPGPIPVQPPADPIGGQVVIPPAVSRLLRPTTPATPDKPRRSAPRRPDPANPPTPGEPREVDAATAWRRVRSLLNQLFEALADLDEAGGIVAAADARGWKPRRWAKQLALVGLLHQMLSDATQRARDERPRD